MGTAPDAIKERGGLSLQYVRAKIALYKDGKKGDDPAHLKAYFAAVKTHPTPSRTTAAVN